MRNEKTMKFKTGQYVEVGVHGVTVIYLITQMGDFSGVPHYGLMLVRPVRVDMDFRDWPMCFWFPVFFGDKAFKAYNA